MTKSLLSLALLFTLASSPALFAQTSASTNAPAATAPSSGGANSQRGEKLKALLEQLNLSDAQKQQIQQIRTNTQPGKERRQQIMAVLTPDQKQKLCPCFKTLGPGRPLSDAAAPFATRLSFFLSTRNFLESARYSRDARLAPHTEVCEGAGHDHPAAKIRC